MSADKNDLRKVDLFSFTGVGFLIAVTANPFFYKTIFEILVGTLIYGFIFLKRGYTVQLEFFYVLLFILAIQVGQSITAVPIPIITLLGLHLRFFLAYFVIRLIKADFFQTVIRVVYIFALIAVPIYIISSIFPSIVDFVITDIKPWLQPPFLEPSKYRTHILVYDFSNFDIIRFGNFRLNSGWYWEPGANAIFLNFALFLNLFLNKKIFTRVNLVLIFSILTTFSTTGYIGFFFVMISFLIFGINQKALGIFLLVPITVLIIFMYSGLEFVGNKLSDDIAMRNETYSNGSRFQSFLYDFDTFTKYPLFGHDDFIEFTTWKWELHRNNGVGVLLASYGIFAFLIYFELFALYIFLYILENF